jgi:hypothetical protein
VSARPVDHEIITGASGVGDGRVDSAIYIRQSGDYVRGNGSVNI